MARSRVVIVEDEMLVAEIVRMELVDNGYEVLGVFPEAEEALRMTAVWCPDIVLMDINLRGEMNGIEAAGHIRREHGIPVIFLSGYSDEETRRRCGVASPREFIAKPWREGDVAEAVRAVLAPGHGG